MRVEEVFPTVREALVRCCDLDPSTITLNSRLVGDLGLESLDFVDLIYEIEQRFEITVPMTGLDRAIEAAMGGEPYEVDGLLTPAALERLGTMVAGLADFDPNGEIATDEVPLLLTVHSVCDLIIREKTEGPAERV